MLHINFKKSLVVGAVLTAVSLNMAFAADNATGKSITPPQQLANAAKALDAEDIFEDIFDVDDLEDLEDLKDILRKHHRQHQDHPWDDEDWNDRHHHRHDWRDDDDRHHHQEIRKERRERIDEAMKHLSSSQRREVLRFIERDREFHRERCAALRQMNDKQRQAVKAHYYGRRSHHGGYHGHGCYRD